MENSEENMGVNIGERVNLESLGRVEILCLAKNVAAKCN